MENYKSNLKTALTGLYKRNGCTDPEKLAETAVKAAKGEAPLPEEQDIMVRLIKGGTYKIKGYYLENSTLHDIRGASTIITSVQENAVPELLEKMLGYNSILYNGGGNLFALVPADCDKDLGILLEAEARRYLLTANTAYSLSEKMQLSELLGANYKSVVMQNENQLNERKKSKIIADIAPESEFLGKELFNGVSIKADKLSEAKKYCGHCHKRLAYYKKDGEYICGGCLHKVCVGSVQKKQYLDEYSEYFKKHTSKPDLKVKCRLKGTKDIDEEHIAVIYADGNNMGGIIQGIDCLDKMIEFSYFVKEKMPEIVYSALCDCQVDRVEFTALGGDDIFIIVPAKKAMRIAVKLIERYNAEFHKKYNKSTLSVGICIAKPYTPIKIMLEAAEDELSKAKELVRTDGCSGSLSYVIFDSYEGVCGDRGKWTLLPYSLDAAKTILDYADKLRKKGTIKTRLQNIAAAFRNADSDTESRLFFEYINAKEKEEKNRIHLPEVDGYTLDEHKCFYQRKDKKLCCIWDDLLDIIKFGE